MILLIYELFSLFINSEITHFISIFGDNGTLIMNIIGSKSLVVLFISIVFFVIGVYKNKRFY